MSILTARMRKHDADTPAVRRYVDPQALARLLAARSLARARRRGKGDTAYAILRAAFRFAARHEIVADRLADALIALDEAAYAVDSASAPRLRELGAPLRRIYEDVNALMKLVTD